MKKEAANMSTIPVMQACQHKEAAHSDNSSEKEYEVMIKSFSYVRETLRCNLQGYADYSLCLKESNVLRENKNSCRMKKCICS